MDSINVDKIEALRKYKEQQFVSNLLFYPLATLTFGVFCTIPFWFPSLYSSSKTLVYVSIPRILSLFLSAKSLFILGNLIVIFLLRGSRFRLSKASDDKKNGDDLVKSVLNKTESKKAKMHEARSSFPLCYGNTDRESVKSEEVMMYAVRSQTNLNVVSERLLEQVFVNSYSTGKIDEIQYVNEKGRRHKSSNKVENPIREKARAKLGNERANLKNGDHNGLVISPSSKSSDALKKRADEFIAMVNEQIRIEAEDEFLDDC